MHKKTDVNLFFTMTSPETGQISGIKFLKGKSGAYK